jgi:molybdopterin-guanine dinucleotide biosynthesis protein A
VVGAAIIAGGKGLRWGGVVKPLMYVDGQRIIERQLAILRPLFDAIAIVIARDTTALVYAKIDVIDVDVDIIVDRQGPDFGPLAGLDAALAWLPARYQSLVCVAGDMPFLAPQVLLRLRDAAPASAIVPLLATGPEPLCARYDRSLAGLVSNELAAGTRAMHVFLRRVAEKVGPIEWVEESELRELDPDLRSFSNLNRPGSLSSSGPGAT